MEKMREFMGEFLGTFIMVVFGTGSVAVSVLFGEYTSIFQIAIMWGVAITLAIYATRNLSCAHFNPAVTIAMAVTGRMRKNKVPIYLIAQFAGAFVGALLVYLLFASDIANYEQVKGIVRGTPESMSVAKMFGEYYQFAGEAVTVSMPIAMLGEGFGTFFLILMIFSLTEGCNTGRPDNNMAPIFIGLTVSSAICLIAPLTQGGFNPARDFAPRMVALIFGWGSAAFPDQSGGFFFVYMLAPVLGGLLAAVFFTKVVQVLMNTKKETCDCEKKEV